MEAQGRVKLWVRVGMTIAVDPSEFVIDQELALTNAIKQGFAVVDGNTYSPTETLEELSDEDAMALDLEDRFEIEWDLNEIPIEGKAERE